MKKEVSQKTNKLFVFTIIIIALFMTFISIEVITLAISHNQFDFNQSLLNTHNSYKYYEIDDSRFNEIIPETIVPLRDLCSKGCNLKVKNFDSMYYYMITFNDQGYRLNIIKNNQIILENKYLGYSISNAYFNRYLEYVAFYNEINDGSFIYDYANVCDSETHVDEFTSLYNNEFEFTDDGIVYYYDVCADAKYGGAQKVKAIRKPFTVNPKIINIDYVDLKWC